MFLKKDWRSVVFLNLPPELFGKAPLHGGEFPDDPSVVVPHPSRGHELGVDGGARQERPLHLGDPRGALVVQDEARAVAHGESEHVLSTQVSANGQTKPYRQPKSFIDFPRYRRQQLYADIFSPVVIPGVKTEIRSIFTRDVANPITDTQPA